MTGWYVLIALMLTPVLLGCAVLIYLRWFAPATSMQTETGRSELMKYGIEFEQVIPCEPEWRAIENEG